MTAAVKRGFEIDTVSKSVRFALLVLISPGVLGARQPDYGEVEEALRLDRARAGERLNEVLQEEDQAEGDEDGVLDWPFHAPVIHRRQEHPLEGAADDEGYGAGHQHGSRGRHLGQPDGGDVIDRHAAHHVELAVGEVHHSQDREDQGEPHRHQGIDRSHDQPVGDLRRHEVAVGHADIVRVGQGEGRDQDQERAGGREKHPAPGRLGREIPERHETEGA